MNPSLRRLLDAHDGVLAWSVACSAVSPGAVEWATRTGQLVMPYPRVLADPAREDVRLPAALICAGPGAALSHTSALPLWRLPVDGTESAVHVTTGLGRRIRVPGIVGHRRAGFAVAPPWAVVRGGLAVTGLEATLVEAWPLLDGDAQRAPLLVAVADRMTTPARILSAIETRPRIRQRAGLATLVELLIAGCRSPLELWGYQYVFVGPQFARLRWQVPIDLGRRTIWLDAFDPESATNFELDGAKYHRSPRDRERDLRRDAVLAARGIQVVRFSHARLTGEVDAVRKEAIDIMAIRAGLGLLCAH